MPISTLGTIACLVLFLLAVATVVLAVSGASRRSERLVEGAVQGIHGIFGVALFASMLLEYAFLAGDTSIQYVQHNSHPAMPLLYKITAFWGSLDGSLLFWVLLLSLFASMAVRANRLRHRTLIPHAVAILATILAFFAALLVFMKNPFDAWLLAEQAPVEGKGLNPLLQNPYMVCHPPSLYLGMVSLAVPYAFGMAALITGQVDEAWQRSVRRWTLFSWLFLSVGLVLGGLWAYEELGWGGYWAWDPVENAGLLPWFTCTAFLHSIMVQERRGMLKTWNLLLVIVTFFLTIFGTFLTRSGVVQSVHAFGEDPALAWTFGGFMLVILVGSFGLLFRRRALLRSRHELESVLSREFAFLVNNWMFLLCALFVAGATMYPTFTQWSGQLAEKYEWYREMMFSLHVYDRAVWDEFLLRGGGPLPWNRVTIGPAFFNHYMAPLGLGLLFLTGFGPLVAWRKTTGASLVEQFRGPLAAGVVATLVAAFAIPLVRSEGGFEILSPEGLACFGLWFHRLDHHPRVLPWGRRASPRAAAGRRRCADRPRDARAPALWRLHRAPGRGADVPRLGRQLLQARAQARHLPRRHHRARRLRDRVCRRACDRRLAEGDAHGRDGRAQGRRPGRGADAGEVVVLPAARSAHHRGLSADAAGRRRLCVHRRRRHDQRLGAREPLLQPVGELGVAGLRGDARGRHRVHRLQARGSRRQWLTWARRPRVRCHRHRGRHRGCVRACCGRAGWRPVAW
ncbi:MAG: cytochrome c biogenesis protein CcsA [Deltaproteobacteria bacterium]|nr:cytochrome c biogenesis protein CcsA [Deltaproteobacteria bacterium]